MAGQGIEESGRSEIPRKLLEMETDFTPAASSLAPTDARMNAGSGLTVLL